MALELLPGALDGIRGTVRYAEAFGLLICRISSDQSLLENGAGSAAAQVGAPPFDY